MLFSFKKKQEQFIKKKTRLGRRRTSAVGRVPTDNNLKFYIMLKIKAIINRVELSVVDGVVNIKIFTNASFDGFRRNIDTTTGAITFEKAKVNFIKFTMSQFIYFVNEVAPLHSYFISGINPYEMKQEVARDLLLGSLITFTSEFQPTGTEYQLADGSKGVTKGERYDNQIKAIEPCDLNQAIIFDTPKTPAMVLAAVNAAKTIAAEVTEVVATKADDADAEAE